jgi:DNA modification methylase
MPEVADGDVQLVVTSPPYWQLQHYGVPQQIGYEDKYGEYLGHLDAVWRECHRVLSSGCRMCVNIGDQFLRAAYYGRYRILPIRADITRSCMEIGFDYMGAIIWQKLTTCNTTGGGSVMGSYPYPRSGAIMIDYEFILVFKKLGKAPVVSRETKESARLTHEQWCEYFAGHWNVHGERQGAHHAVFPEEIPRRLIRMYSFPGEIVLDPFLGSGTTVKVAADEGRLGVGYEINEEFAGVMASKLSGTGAVYERREGPPPLTGAGASAGSPSAGGPAPNRLDLDRTADPGSYDFGSRVFHDRPASAGELVKVAEELSHAPDWWSLNERKRLTRIVDRFVGETGADRKLVRLGTRNALQKVPSFVKLVRAS